MAAIRQFGDWNKAISGFLAFPRRNDDLIEKIVLKASVMMSRAIIKNLKSSGSYVGKPFKALSANTPRSGKPLIDNGDMMRSVTNIQIDRFTSFAGVFKSTTDGVNLAAVHDKGTNRAGRGNSVTIPSRPWITSVITSDKVLDEIEEMMKTEYEEGVRRIFGV